MNINRNHTLKMQVAYLSCAVINLSNFSLGYSFQTNSKDFIK
jgi:hypothetical protein